MLSTRLLLPAFQAMAALALAPIFRVPLLIALITKAVTLPSTSASSPWAVSSAKVISTVLSSLVVSAAAANVVRVGASLTAVILSVVVAMPVCTPFFAASLLTSFTV